MFLAKDSNSNEPIRVWETVSKAGSPDVAAALRLLLGDVVTFYFRAHGYHWNVKGQDFSQYHELFGEIYEDAYGSVDPIAENMLKMGVDAPYRLSEFVSNRTLQDSAATPTEPRAMASDLLAANRQVLTTLNMAFTTANAANEQGIANFLAERIDMHQKWSWQLQSSGA